MATTRGPAQIAIPTGSDAAGVPADLARMVDSMTPSLVGHADSTGDRDGKYADAPVGTMVISVASHAIWVKTAGTPGWVDFFGYDPNPTLATGYTTINPGTRFVLSSQTIQIDGMYSIYGFIQVDAAGHPDSYFSGLTDMYMAYAGNIIQGTTSALTSWSSWVGARPMRCSAGDVIQLCWQHHSGTPIAANWQQSYQRIA